MRLYELGVLVHQEGHRTVKAPVSALTVTAPLMHLALEPMVCIPSGLGAAHRALLHA